MNTEQKRYRAKLEEKLGLLPSEVLDEEWANQTALVGVSEMFQKMMDTCFEKCTTYRIPHAEAQMGTGEGVCMDRCLLKYSQAQALVGSRLKRHSAQTM